MATAADIIKGALRKLGILESETPIEDSEISDGLEDLNDWGAALERRVQLGFVPVSSPGDTINIPTEAVGAYKLGLAVYIAPDYEIPVTQELLLNAKAAMNTLLVEFQGPIDVEFPDTLPTGSGNDCDSLIFDERFFPENQKENF